MSFARIAFGFVLMIGVAVAQQYVISTYAGGAPLPTPVAAVNASLPSPFGVAVDSLGNTYFTADNCVFEIDGRGVLTRLAGTSHAGYSGDGGQATSAQLSSPTGLTFDSSGNLYIAEFANRRVRKLSPTGIISTVAGNGTRGYSGDGGPATSAQLLNPEGLAMDGSGNLYIGDDVTVRMVSPTGIITTVAGNGSLGYSGDGGPATSARLSGALGVAVDAAGNLYIAETSNNRIRMVSPSGIISTVAGNGTRGYSGDGGPAIDAQLNEPFSVAIDTAGNLYISDWLNNRIRKVSQAGVITTVAGGGNQFPGDDGLATNARLFGTEFLAVDSTNAMFIADTSSNRLFKVSPAGIISTLAGDGTTGGYSGDDGPATNARMSYVDGVALDSVGNLYVADANNYRIRKVSPAGIISTVAGNGTRGYSGDGGPATSAQLLLNLRNSEMNGLAVDSVGKLYIADSGNSRIRVVSPDGIISTVAGNGTAGYSGDGGSATDAQIKSPTGLAVDSAGNLYIADSGNNCIRMVTPNGIITTVAGNGTAGYSGDGGPATSAQLSQPRGLAVDVAGSLFIADLTSGRIRKVSPTGVITTAAGGGINHLPNGGPAINLFLSGGLAVDTAGNLYIGVVYLVYKVSPSGTITTIAGTTDASNGGDTAYSGDGGLATNAQIQAPEGIAVDSKGNVYLADDTNNAVRLLRPLAMPLSVAIPLPSGTVGAPYSAQLEESGGTPPYSWTIIAGDLPDGLTLSNTTGTINGTPTTAGISVFTIQVADSASATATQAFSINVMLPTN